MKNLLLIFTTILLFSSCIETSSSNNIISDNKDIIDLKIVIYDNCEYLKYRTSYGYYELTHKGNCNNPIHKH